MSALHGDVAGTVAGVALHCATKGLMDVRAKHRGHPQPKSGFSCGPGDEEKLFDPWAPGRKGQKCPQEIRTKISFLLFFLP